MKKGTHEARMEEYGLLYLRYCILGIIMPILHLKKHALSSGVIDVGT